MKLIYKELRLATSPLSWLFLLFSAMTLIPGYPIALGAFFVCLGLFQSVQLAREAGDILYSALLPIPKRDVVTAKYLVSCFFELIAFTVMAALTAVRLTALRGAPVYVQNALLPANLTFLALALLIFAMYNLVFLGGFFRTAYKFGKPFIFFIVVTMLLVGLGEALPHFPGLGFLGGTAHTDLLRQTPVLLVGAAVYIGGTLLSLRLSQRRFEKLDL